MKTAALVLGILSLVFCWIPGLGFIMALIGLILGIVAVNKKDEEGSKGPAIAGIVTSALAIVSAGIITFIVVFLGNFLFNVHSDEIIDRVRETTNSYYRQEQIENETLQNSQIQFNEILQNAYNQ